MLKAVIFDMDGVIVDSEPAHFQADSELFSSLGIHLENEERALFYGVSTAWMWNYIIERQKLDLSIDDILRIDLAIRKTYLLPPKLPPLIPGIEPLLQKFSIMNIPMALASSTVSEIVKPLIQALGLERFFRFLVTGDQVKNAKPAPDIFILAARMLGESPENCLVIEDSPNGIMAAKTAGMRCIGYSPGPDHALYDADIIIRNFEELDSAMLKRMLN